MTRFDLWMHRVNRHLVEVIGLDADSLEDFLWRDHFDAGYLPLQAVEAFLEYHGLATGRTPQEFV